MTIPEILKELELYTGRFPMDAMRAAVEQREAITPELLRVLESVAEDPVRHAERKDYMLHDFALYLLAISARNVPTRLSSRCSVPPAKRRSICLATRLPRG